MNAKRASKFESVLMAELCTLDEMVILTCSPILVTNGVLRGLPNGPTRLQIISGTPPQKIGFNDEYLKELISKFFSIAGNLVQSTQRNGMTGQEIVIFHGSSLILMGQLLSKRN